MAGDSKTAMEAGYATERRDGQGEGGLFSDASEGGGSPQGKSGGRAEFGSCVAAAIKGRPSRGGRDERKQLGYVTQVEGGDAYGTGCEDDMVQGGGSV